LWRFDVLSNLGRSAGRPNHARHILDVVAAIRLGSVNDELLAGHRKSMAAIASDGKQISRRKGAPEQHR
jgi:hypothetical protein